MSKSKLIFFMVTLLLVQSLSLKVFADESNFDEQIQAVVILDKLPKNFYNTPSSPPLATDDTGTPGKKGVEINFVSDCDRSRSGKSCEMIIDSNFGIGEKIQLKIEKAAVHETSPDDASFRGAGPTSIGLKYRFYDRSGTTMAVYPTYKMNDGTKRTNEDGEELKTEGRSIYLPLIISKDMGTFTTVANIGYTHAIDARDDSSITTALSVGRAINDTSRVMAEIYSERNTNFSNRRTDVRVGWVKLVLPNNSSRYQTSIFTSIGRSVGSTEDGVPHTTVQFGISIVKK